MRGNAEWTGAINGAITQPAVAAARDESARRGRNRSTEGEEKPQRAHGRPAIPVPANGAAICSMCRGAPPPQKGTSGCGAQKNAIPGVPLARRNLTVSLKFVDFRRGGS